MSKPIRKSASIKVRKPSKEFPLFPHATGIWAKKIRQRLVYFGSTLTDPKGEAALQKWLDQKDDLLAGRTPRAGREGLTVGDCCNRFLTSKTHMMETAELTLRTFRDYHSTCERLVEAFGKGRLVDDLAADDFERLRAILAKVRGPVALGNEINRVRVVFKYAFDSGLTDKPMRYGPGFKRPGKKILYQRSA